VICYNAIRSVTGPGVPLPVIMVQPEESKNCSIDGGMDWMPAAPRAQHGQSATAPAVPVAAA